MQDNANVDLDERIDKDCVVLKRKARREWTLWWIASRNATRWRPNLCVTNVSNKVLGIGRISNKRKKTHGKTEAVRLSRHVSDLPLSLNVNFVDVMLARIEDRIGDAQQRLVLATVARNVVVG